MDTVYGVRVDPTGVKTGVKQAVSELNKLPGAMRNVQQRASKSFDTIRDSIFSIRGALVSAFTGLSFASIIREGREFGAAIGELSAITGAVGTDLEFLAMKSREFGRSTTLSAVESAEAFKLIASAKPDLLENADALAQVTEQAIILAEATGQDLPTAAESLGSALNQFGEGADQASRFINVLAAGSKRGASLVGDAAEALKFAGTVAADAGLSFETTVAAIQQLSKVSIKGGEAGTGLRNVIIRLGSSTDRNLRPSVVGLAKALENLNAKQLSTAELTEIVGLRSVVTLKSLLANVDGLVELEGQITKTNTALEQQAAKIDNLDGDIKQLGSAYSDLKIELESLADDALRGLTQSMTEFFRSVVDNIDEILRMAKAVGTLVASIAAARILGPILSALYTAIMALPKALAVFRTGLIASQVAMTATIGVLGALRAAFSVLGGPVGIIIAAVGTVYAWVTATREAEASTDSYASSLDKLRSSMSKMTRERIDAEIVRQGQALASFKDQLNEANEQIEIISRRRNFLGAKPQDNARVAELTKQANDELALAVERQQELQEAVQDTQLAMAELEAQRLEVNDPAQLDTSAVGQARKEVKGMIAQFDDLLQRGREALKGVFPEAEEIARLKAAQKELMALQTALKEADPAVRKELEEEGITIEYLQKAYQKRGQEIEEQRKKSVELTEESKAYKNELDRIEKSLSMATFAAKNNGMVTELSRVEYELAEGALKKFANTAKAKAITDKAAALDAAKLTAQVVTQTRDMATANDLAALAQMNAGRVSQMQRTEYDLTKGSLKDLNDEATRAALIAQAARADDIALTIEADAVKDTLEPLRAYNREIERLTMLHEKGKLSQDEFAQATRNAALQQNDAARIIRGEFGTAISDITSGAKTLTDAISEMATNIWRSINDVVSKKLGEKLFDSLFTPGPNQQGAGGILDLFNGAAKKATGAASDTSAAPAKAVGAVAASATPADSITAALSTTWSGANPLPVRIVDGGSLVASVESMARSTENPAAAIEKIATQANPLPVETVSGASGEAAQETVKAATESGFAGVFSNIADGATSLWQRVKGGFGDVLGSLSSTVSSLFSNISGMFSGGGTSGGGGFDIGSLATAAMSLFGAAHGADFKVGDLKRFAHGGALAAGMLALPGFAHGADLTSGKDQIVTFRATPNETVTVTSARDTLAGFSSGGSFRVGGSGGIDSQVVSFKANADDRVTITRPQDGVPSFAHGGSTLVRNLPGFASGGEINFDPVMAAQSAAAPTSNARDTSRNESSPSLVVTNHFAISAPNGRVDRESQNQIAARVGRSIDNAMRRNT